ncbi:MAG: lysophospholipid acyltransferase family protein [Planctomycetota bacterium]
MSVVLERPYQFVPPYRHSLWPTLIQAFRLVDLYLAKKEGVVDYQVRGLEHWKSALDAGQGVLLAPNHCRYADPLVIGWPARELGVHVHAVASWHLFNVGWFDSFALRRMGAFSINREGSDKQSLESAIDILATGSRSLVLFPEGTTNRTNDVLKPLLDGVAFIARAAGKKRRKAERPPVVMLPTALKYLCVRDGRDWMIEQLEALEDHFGWQRQKHRSILDRTVRLAEAMLSLKEIEYLGQSETGDLRHRRDHLMVALLDQAEDAIGLVHEESGSDVRERVRRIRSEVVSKHFSAKEQDESRAVRLRGFARMADLAQSLLSYPDCYLESTHVTETRIIETIQRMQEQLFGKSNNEIELKVVIQFDEPIEVDPKRPPRDQTDPVMTRLSERLTAMLGELSLEARDAQSAQLTTT